MAASLVAVPVINAHVDVQSFGPGNNYAGGHDHRDEFDMGDGADSAHLYANDDLLKGEEGFDGINSPDALIGGGGQDRILGGLGKDDLYGHENGDHLSGNQGEDVVRGADGQDEVEGGTDSDTVTGGVGIDIHRGEAGEDFLDAADNQGNEAVHGGEEYDICQVDATSGGVVLDNPTGCQDLIKVH